MPLLQPHCFSYLGHGIPNPSLSKPVKISQQIDHISSLVHAALFEEQPSLPTRFPNAPEFEQKIHSEVESLKGYIGGITDPKEHLRQLLRIETPPDLIDCEINQLAIVLKLDGNTFAGVAEKLNSRRPSSVSLGITLALEQIPEALRGRLVLVNEGDGGVGHRDEHQIKLTKRHELLHVIFSEFFATTDFITTPRLIQKLEDVTGPFDIRPFEQLAENLLESMFERARSEIISYCACGTLDLCPYKVDAHFWFDHIPAVVAYINSNSFSEQQGDAILKVFVDAYEEYWRMTDRYLNIAFSLPQQNNGLSAESIAYLLALNRGVLSENL
jgi:hypothetical protein